MKSIYTTIKKSSTFGCFDLVTDNNVTVVYSESHVVCEAVQACLEFPNEADGNSEAWEVANGIRLKLKQQEDGPPDTGDAWSGGFASNH